MIKKNRKDLKQKLNKLKNKFKMINLNKKLEQKNYKKN